MMALAMTEFPAGSLVMVSACRIGTPEDSMEAQVVQGLNLFTMLLIVCLMMIRGKRGANQYGEDPLAHDIAS